MVSVSGTRERISRSIPQKRDFSLLISKKQKTGHVYAKHFTYTMSCVSYSNPARKHHYPHFTYKESEAQEDKVTCPKSHSY